MKEIHWELAGGAVLGGVLFALWQGHGATVLPVIVLGGLIVALIFYANSGGLRTGISRYLKASDPRDRRAGIGFDAIGGQTHAKTELREALSFLQHLDAARSLGIRPLRGILLSGPPGNGKTMLARAAANFTRSSFISVSGSEFVEMYAGVGASRVRGLFRQARRQAREEGRASAMLFIDELEVIAGRRGRHTSHLEYDQTLNQLLVEMDGMESGGDVHVLVIGATNRVDLIDDALLRPGRFDRVVRVELPDRRARLRILEIHTAGKPLAEGIELDRIAADTFGFSGAQLESVTNEAAILALREEATCITQEHLSEAVEKVMLGERLDRQLADEDRRRVAVHELGHAVVSEVLEPGSVARVMVAPRGEALGYVRNRGASSGRDRFLETENQLRRRLAVMLAGSAAEAVILGERSTGAGGDLREARVLARHIVECGMSELGYGGVESVPAEHLHEVMTDLLAWAEREAREIVVAHQRLISALAARLMQEERLTGPALRRALAFGDAASVDAAAP